MSKVLDWDKIADRTAFDDNRREAVGQTSFRQLITKSYAKQESQQEQAELIKAQEPFLRNELLKHMVNRIPIKVLFSFQNITEGLGGEGGDEIDDAFYNGAAAADPMEKSERRARAGYREVLETIPTGTELIFKNWNKTLGQWVFTDSINNREFAIYDKPVIMTGEGRNIQQVKNPGFYGLLFNTHLVQKLGE